MTKTTRALSGTSKDAYFRNAIAAETDIADEARERLIGRFQRGVSLVRVRQSEAAARGAALIVDVPEVEKAVATSDFDPFTPNVLVAVRREGADATLRQLMRIGNAQNLRLLAREQQLSIADDLESFEEMAHAIVDAASRRIANMRAAAR